MIKRIFALLLVLLLAGLCACSAPTEAELRAGEEERYLTLWSWQMPDPALAADYAKAARECGFTAIDLGVQWSAFEPLRGQFSWEWMDRVVEAFAKEGLKVSLQPLLWSKDLAWAEELTFQETKNGLFSVEGRGCFVSFTEEETLKIIENSIARFADHAADYKETLCRWGVRLSSFGEFDYSLSESLDYSPSAAKAFRDYIKENYNSVQDFSAAFSMEISAWEELENLPCFDLAQACPLAWRRFRSACLTSLWERISPLFREADEDVPIVFMLGTVGNSMNSNFSAVTDLFTLCDTLDFDQLGVSLSDGVSPALLLSYVTSVTDKALCVEVDGAGAWEEGDKKTCAEQVSLCAAYGVTSLSTANFTLQQLEEHQAFLTAYQTLFATEKSVEDCTADKGILLLTDGLILQNPPLGLETIYGEDFALLSENGRKKVQFLTDGMIAENPQCIKEISELYTGKIKGTVPLPQKAAAALQEADVRIFVKDLILTTPAGDPFLPAHRLQTRSGTIQ